jgi:hypothetical protein
MTISEWLRVLVAKREQAWRGFFVIAAVPLVLLALGGLEYGGFETYASLTSVCLAQAIYPTLLGWGIVFGLYAAGGVAYICALVPYITGHAPDGDWGLATILLVLCSGIAITLFFHRPKALPAK